MKFGKIILVVLLVLVFSVLFFGCRDKNFEGTGKEETVSTTPEESLNSVTEKLDEVSSTGADPQSETSVESAEIPETAVSTTNKKQPAKEVIVYKSEGTRRIWAGIVGKIYVTFKTVEESDGIGRQVYELWVDPGDGYTVWADGVWELNERKTELKLTPKNQSENGNIGIAIGETKTYKTEDGVFKVEFTFEQGGKSAIKFNPTKDVV